MQSRPHSYLTAGVLLVLLLSIGATAPASPTDLLQRAQTHDIWMRTHHMPAGGVMAAQFTDASYSEIALYGGRRDPAIWTGAYLAAQALRLMETGDSDAATRLAAVVQTLHDWWRISGDTGYLARFAAPADSAATILATLPADDPEVIRDVPYDGELWHWRGRVSRDQYQGVLLGMSLAYEATADAAIRQRIREDVTAFVERLMQEEERRVKVVINDSANFSVDLRLRHAVYTDDETPSGIPVINITTDPVSAEGSGMLVFWPNPSEYLREIPGLWWLPDIELPTQAIQLAGAFRVALQVTQGVPGYEARHAALRAHYEENVEAWLDMAADWENTNQCGDSYYGLNIAFLPLFNWVRLEDDMLRRGRLQREVLRDALWSEVADHKNVLFALLYASQAAPEDAIDDLINAHLAQLARFPDAPQLDLPFDLRSKYAEDPNCPGLSSVATDVDERPGATYIWERHPWQLVDSGTPNLVFAGVDYLLAYWLGRHAGFLCEADELTLTAVTVDGSRRHVACRDLRAGPDVTVSSTGDLALRAGRQIQLLPGFRVEAGGLLQASIDPTLASRPLTGAPLSLPTHARTSSQAPAPRSEARGQTAGALSPPMPAPGAEALTWSMLPAELQEQLLAHDAKIHDAQRDSTGDIIVFATEAPLAWEDTNGQSDIYLYAVASERLHLVSLALDGYAGNGSSDEPRLDGLGQQLLFRSTATNLVVGAQNDFAQLYQHDLGIGSTTRLTQTARGEPGTGNSGQAILAGTWAIFHTEAANLAAAGPGLYRQQLSDASRQPVGLDEWGLPDPAASRPAADSAGAEIAYQRPEPNGMRQIYLTDAVQAERLSLTSDPVLGQLDHCCAALSRDGGLLAYREQTSQGQAWLHVYHRNQGSYYRLPWPRDETLQSQAPVFNHDGSELWWLNPEQGPGLPEVLHWMKNPFGTAENRPSDGSAIVKVKAA